MYLRIFSIVAVLMAGVSLSGKAVAQQSTDRELHAVGLYEGSIRTGGVIHGGRASVTVDRPGKDVTLYFNAYEPVTWNVNIGDNTNVEKVILGGYHRQAVTGLPPGVEIVNLCLDRSENCFRAGYELNTPEFHNAQRSLKDITGLDLSSFQGRYAFVSGNPFIINQIDNDPVLSTDFPQGTSYLDLPSLSFKGIHFSDNVSSYGAFTLEGPMVNSLRPLPRNIRKVAIDESSDSYYGIGGHGIISMDSNLQTVEELDLGLDVPRLSWPVGITYDTARDRVLLASLGGEGFLYSYEPDPDTWSVVSSMNNIDLIALEYHAANDSVYGLAQPYGDTVMPVLHQFNANGALLRTFSLSDPMLPGILDGEARPQLISVDDYLVILKEPSVDPFSRTFLVEPDSGAVFLVVPEPSTLLLTITGFIGAVGYAGLRRRRKLMT